jgi:hypothetical protein
MSRWTHTMMAPDPARHDSPPARNPRLEPGPGFATTITLNCSTPRSLEHGPWNRPPLTFHVKGRPAP